MLTIRKTNMRIHKGTVIEVVQNCYKMIDVKELFISHVGRKKGEKKRMFGHGAIFLPVSHD